jgi:septal ring factor EnvC (AmiA/AmiB activator)
MENEIIIPESAASVEAVQVAASAEVAAQAAAAAIQSANHAGALAEVAAAESIAAHSETVAELETEVEQQRENTEWLAENVQACLQNQAQITEQMESMQSAIIALTQQLTQSNPNPSPSPDSPSEHSPISTEEGEIQTADNPPSADAADHREPEKESPPVPAKRKHRAL